MPREWTIRCEGRGWSHNAERRMHWAERSRLVKQWRTDFGWLVRQQRIPHLDRVAIEVRQECRTANLPDNASAATFAKPAIDSLVDCGVIDDDDGEHVEWIRFWPAVKTGKSALVLRIVERPKPKESNDDTPSIDRVPPRH